MAIGNVRPFVLDTSGFDNALSGMFAGIKQRRQDAEYGDLLNTLSAPAPVMNALSGPSEVGAPPSVTSNPSIDANAPTRGGFTPKYLVMHDYGGNPKNAEGVHNPYHALVFPDGSIRYRDPNNPYGGKAPHAYNLNSESIGLSYAGPVGSKPTPEAMATLQKEAQRIAQMYPGIRPMSHGEAFQATKGTARQASKLGRGLDEASWRQNVVYGPAGQPGQAAPQPQAIPVASRAVTAVAGSQPVRTADAGDGRSAALEWARRNPGHPAAKAIGQEVLSQQLDPMASVKQQQAQANLQNTLTEQQRSQVEFFGKRAMAIQQMSPEIRARVWPQVLAELQRAFPNDPIDPEEADPETGPQILAAQAGMLLDPMAGEERRLKMEQLRAETAKTQREAQAGPSTVKGAPPGYSWIDPNNPEAGVKPLPGFEKPIPGDVAGKVAMMSMARKNIENSRGTFERPWNAGDVAKFGAANVPLVGDIGMLSGDVGMALRDIRVGVEAALRTMTGAAAPEQEVRRYVDMFSPRPTDTSDVVRQKIDGLMQFMADAERLVVQGRGVDPGMIPQQTAPQSPTQAAPTQASAPRSKQEYDALPSGTQYTAPDGSVRVKP